MGKSIIVSAPGKLMLFGEHAVVYGYPCLVTAVNQRLKTTVTTINKPELRITAEEVHIDGYSKQLQDLGKEPVPKGVLFIEHAVKNMYKSYGIKQGLEITTTAGFSSQFGFGSSSAVTVCVIKAVSELFELDLSLQQIFTLAYKTVLDIQQKGSGFDVAAAIYGGTLFFTTGGKEIEPLDLKDIPLVVGYSGIKADTVTLVNRVQEKMIREPEAVTTIYKGIVDVVTQAKQALVKKDWQNVGNLMNINQGYLRELGVSITKLDAMIHAANKAGAYGAKLSGAGGGDCIIAIVSQEKKETVEKVIIEVGGIIIPVRTNAEGVRVEND